MKPSIHPLSQLSVLIVTYHGDDLLANCLASLSSACSDLIEIVVVDNSANATTEQIVRRHRNAKYVAAETNLGFAGGNNLGLPYCTRPFALLLNNDTIIHDEPFSDLIRYLEEHPKVAVVQGKMKLPNQGDVLDSCGSLLTPIGVPVPLYEHAPLSTPLVSRPVFAAKGACMLFKKSIIEKVGGFLFYNHFKSYYEDVDFCHRVWLAGFEVHFVNTNPIDHLQGRTAAKFNYSEIAAQSQANADFSLFTTLGFRGRYTIGIYRKLFFLILALCARIKGNKQLVLCLRQSRSINASRRKEVIQARKAVQLLSNTSDSAIFKTIVTIPPIVYYKYFLKGEADQNERLFWK